MKDKGQVLSSEMQDAGVPTLTKKKAKEDQKKRKLSRGRHRVKSILVHSFSDIGFNETVIYNKDSGILK